MKRIYFSVVMLCLPVLTFAALLKGKVIDEQGRALPFATVFIKGTTIGTSANADGEYQLNLNAGTFQVASQYIGYKQQVFSITIQGNETITHDIKLEDQNVRLSEHVVKSSEDPALYIMRKVIAKRSFHLHQINSFQTDIYLKGVFRTRMTPNKVLGEKVEPGELGLDTSGKGILYLCEENATYYSQDAKSRTVIHSVRESGNPNGFGFSTFPPVISFYQNNINISEQISPRGFISPVNDFALNYYKYKLEGDFKEGNNTIYKIKVTPKRLYEPLFYGYIYIVDDEYAIHSLHLTATKKSNMQMLDTFSIEQVYLPLTKDTWVIKQQVLYPTIKIFGFDFTGYFVTIYNQQKINQPAPDSIFNPKVVSVYDKTANKKDSSYWSETRPVPLNNDEIIDYVRKDSIRIAQSDPKYLDSMRRIGNKVSVMNFVLSGVNHRGKKDKYSFHTNALLTGLVNFNTVEGFNVAPKVYWNINVDTFHTINGVVAARYGFSNEHFNGIGKLSYTARARSWRGRYWTLGAEGGKYVFQFNPNNPIEPLYNTISTLFYRNNYLKLYERWNANLFFKHNIGTGFQWSAQLGFQQRIPLDNTTDFSFAKTNAGGYTDNIPTEYKKFIWEKHNAVIAKLSVSYQPGYTYTQFPDYMMPHGSNMPVFTLSYEKGIPNILNSKTDYDKWRLNIRDQVGLKLLGDFSYNIAAGGFLNTNYVSIPDLNHIIGNQITIATPYLESFQLAPYYLYSNKASLYGEGHVEWNLKGFITNKIPIFRQLRWYLVAGSNAYYVNKDLYHIEAFAGIDNVTLLKVLTFRFDYVLGWNNMNQQLFGLRLGISGNSLMKVNFSDKNSEW